jgi:hypothetical protein
MASRSIPFLSCSSLLLVLASAALDAGGWAVITVKDLPDYVVVGRPVTLTYAVRQHGRELLNGLNGRLEMRRGAYFVPTAATAASEPGHYSATFTLPYAGNWSIDIVSGWASGISGSKLTIQAIEPEAQVPVVTEVERGHRLFTAKGCVTCHLHGAVEGPHISIGAPELTSKRHQPEYLKRFLANPPQPQAGQQPGGMPDLELRHTEIASLVAFINAGGKP